MIERNFKNWYAEEVELTFDIQQVDELPLLEKWLASKYTYSEKEQERLMEIQNLLRRNVRSWNEDELKFYFIGPLMLLVNYHTDKYNPFLERHLSATIKDYNLKGRIDFILATGRDLPRAPYFCLHEYKKEKGVDNDPLGQLLIEMLVIQALNDNKLPIYGAYVLGRLWFFVVLDKDKYAVSLAYDTTQEDIYNVFAILQQLKVIIDAY